MSDPRVGSLRGSRHQPTQKECHRSPPRRVWERRWIARVTFTTMCGEARTTGANNEHKAQADELLQNEVQKSYVQWRQAEASRQQQVGALFFAELAVTVVVKMCGLSKTCGEMTSSARATQARACFDAKKTLREWSKRTTSIRKWRPAPQEASCWEK